MTMDNLNSLATIVRQPTPEEAHDFESAGQVLERLAAEIQIWLHDMALNKASTAKRWVLSASLSNGATINVHSLSARGHSMLKLEGELPDGTPCLLVGHQYSVQLLAYHVARKTEEPPNREIGFHTGIGKEIMIEQ